MDQVVIAAVLISALGALDALPAPNAPNAEELESTAQPGPQPNQARSSAPRIQIARPRDGARPVICKSQLLPGSYMRERVCKSKPAWQGQPDIAPGRAANPDDDPAE